MKKVRFLQDFYTFDRDSYRVILKEDSEYYYNQEHLHTLDNFRLPKRNNGVLFQVVERS